MSPVANPIGMKLQSFGSKKILSNLSKAYPEGSLLTSQFLCDVTKPPRKQKKQQDLWIFGETVASPHSVMYVSRAMSKQSLGLGLQPEH